MDHARIEERSIALHREIAGRIKENPALWKVARANFRHWFLQGGERSYLEGMGKTAGPLEDLLAFMVSPEEKARGLRQSSPFCGILTPRERWNIYESFAESIGEQG